MSEESKKLEEIFHRLVEMHPDERAQAALGLANLDAAVARRALELVEAHDRAAAANRAALSSSLVASVPKEFGPYRTVRLLGAGGMGAVYLCERADGAYHGQVAVKVIGQHLAGPGFDERFRAERQILATLNHPNIARLLDGNVSSNGEPYLVLEYIEGDQLDIYCDRQSFTTEQRLALFLKICGAVDFAHRNLVVHRDLKPSNILVTPAGEPKLLDFGAARLLSAEVSNTTIPMLTLRYASPEQLRAQPVTTATDVYSLGVVLYEVLAGASPFGDAGSWELALSRATGDAPVRPDPNLTGDLWTIIRKSLAQEADRRYPSVREFAEDIERYLAGRPILARPSTFGYRAAKFVRRNRWASVSAAIVAVVILTGTASTLWQARKAQRRFEELRELASYMVGDMSTGLLQLPGSTSLLRANVERSLAYLDGLAAESQTDTGLRLEAAEGYLRLGDVLGNPYRANLSDRPSALAAYKRGLAVLESAPSSVESRRLAAELRMQIGGVKSFGGERNAGLDEIRQSVELLKQLATERPHDSRIRLATACGLDFLAKQLTVGGGTIENEKHPEVIAQFNEAMRHNEAVLAREAQNPIALRQAALVEINIALLHGSDSPQIALDHHQRAIAYLARLKPEDAATMDLRRLLGNSLANQGWALGQLLRYDEAITSLNGAEATVGAIAAVDPGNTNLLYQLTSILRARGIIEGYRKNYQKAAEEYLNAAELHRRLSEKDPPNKVYRYLRGELLVRAGGSLAVLNRQADARKSTAEGLSILESLAAAPGASLTHLLAGCRFFAETTILELRDLNKAEAFCRSAIATSNNSEPDAFSGLALVSELRGDRPAALVLIRKGLELIPPAVPGKPVSKQRTELESKMQRLRARATPN